MSLGTLVDPHGTFDEPAEPTLDADDRPRYRAIPQSMTAEYSLQLGAVVIGIEWPPGNRFSLLLSDAADVQEALADQMHVACQLYGEACAAAQIGGVPPAAAEEHLKQALERQLGTAFKPLPRRDTAEVTARIPARS